MFLLFFFVYYYYSLTRRRRRRGGVVADHQKRLLRLDTQRLLLVDRVQKRIPPTTQIIQRIRRGQGAKDTGGAGQWSLVGGHQGDARVFNYFRQKQYRLKDLLVDGGLSGESGNVVGA